MTATEALVVLLLHAARLAHDLQRAALIGIAIAASVAGVVFTHLAVTAYREADRG